MKCDADDCTNDAKYFENFGFEDGRKSFFKWCEECQNVLDPTMEEAKDWEDLSEEEFEIAKVMYS